MQASPRPLAFVLVVLVTSMSLGLPLASILSEPAAANETPQTPALRIAAVITDPQQDHDASGATTSTDERVLLHNPGDTTIDLTGWELVMSDTTPETETLTGTISPNGTYVVANPRGQMNNDVQLTLRAPDGRVHDERHLGHDGVPDGNAAEPDDETVWLVGPWNATRAPWNGQALLGAYWVGAAQVFPNTTHNGTIADALNTSTARGDLWMGQAPARLGFRLHVAPGLVAAQPGPDGGFIVVLEETDFPLTVLATDGQDPSGGTRMVLATDALAPPASISHEPGLPLALQGPDASVFSFPGGRALALRADPTAPSFDGTEAVARDDGNVTWLPPARDPETGISNHTVRAQGADGNDLGPVVCMIREDGAAAGSGCRVDAENATALWLRAENAVGGVIERVVPLRYDATPPGSVGTPDVSFAPGRHPSLSWPPSDEPLLYQSIEVAEDVTGTWFIETKSVAANATTWNDTSYAPGDARAYRWNRTDRAGWTTVGPWVSLDPAAVPIHLAQTDPKFGSLLAKLAGQGSTELVLRFDRALAEAPRIVVSLSHPVPYHLEVDGTLAAERHTVAYVVAPEHDLPRWASGIVRLTGGRGTDTSPVQDLRWPVAYDVDPPQLHFEGARPWVAGKRHIVHVQASDATDPHPIIRLDTKPNGVTMSGKSDDKRITFRGEGRYEVAGHAEDDSGLRRVFQLSIGLDATVPEVSLQSTHNAGERWSAQAPVLLTASDDLSGVDPTSWRVWVRNATASTEALVRVNESQIIVTPSAGLVLEAPLEVHAAVADRAGNLAEGLVGRPLPKTNHAPQRSPADDEVVRMGLGANHSASNDPAPAPKGPDWGEHAADARAGKNGASARSGGMDAQPGLWDDAAWGALRAKGAETAKPGDDEDGRAAGWGLGLVGTAGLAGLGTTVVRRRRVKTGGRRSA